MPDDPAITPGAGLDGLAEGLAMTRFNATFDPEYHTDDELDDMRAIYFDGYVTEAKSDLAYLLDALRSLPVEQRMEAMGMEKVDPFETFTASDGMPAIRGRRDVWAPKA